MNCRDAQRELVNAVYDELPPGRRAGFDGHLAHCGSCRAEFETLQQGRRLLDLLPADADAEVTAIDTRRLFHTAAVRAQRQRRGWKWAAGGCALAAAVLLVVLLSRLHVEAAPGRIVIGWGERAAAGPVDAPAMVHADDLAPLLRETSELADRLARHERDLHDLASQLQTVGELAQLATRELLSVDQRHSSELSRLRSAVDRLGRSTAAALREVRQQGDLRWWLTLHELEQPGVREVGAVETRAGDAGF